MKFLHLDNKEEGAEILAEKIRGCLEQTKKVLWLLSGGSNISAAVGVLNILKDNYKYLPLKDNLAVILMDERFGPVGHPDSNWQQLSKAGFDMEKVIVAPVLHNLSLEETVNKFENNYKKLALWADVIIGQFGLGSDGHTAGVLPGTVGVTSIDTVCAYESDKYTRITLTLNTIMDIDIAYIFAFGESKKEIVFAIKAEDISIAEIPAQALKQIPESYLYSDQI
jgi:6-phosphogluconolactonase/glucosamine-6-phosphate isomerase/deaminase